MVAVGVAEAVGEAVTVAVDDGVGVAVRVGEGVGVGVRDTVGVCVGVAVWVGVGVGGCTRAWKTVALGALPFQPPRM